MNRMTCTDYRSSLIVSGHDQINLRSKFADVIYWPLLPQPIHPIIDTKGYT